MLYNVVVTSDVQQILKVIHIYMGFLEDSMVKNLPAKQETGVPSLGWEDPLEKEMANHSSILAWEILWTKEHGRLQSKGLQKSWTQLSN